VVDKLVNNREYPNIASDYQASFKKLRALPCDVFLAPHPGMFNMDDKLRRMKHGAPNPFIDSGEYARFVDTSEQDFRAELKKQTVK